MKTGTEYMAIPFFKQEVKEEHEEEATEDITVEVNGKDKDGDDSRECVSPIIKRRRPDIKGKTVDIFTLFAFN